MHLLLERIRWVDRNFAYDANKNLISNDLQDQLLLLSQTLPNSHQIAATFALPSYETYSIQYQLGGAGASQGLPSTID
jgi:hypothetical protein